MKIYDFTRIPFVDVHTTFCVDGKRQIFVQQMKLNQKM